jgi:hypothetical protein
MGFFVRFLFCLALLTTGVLIAPDAGSQAYVCNPACSPGGNEGRTQASGGAGLEYPVWRKLAARLEYEYYGKATRRRQDGPLPPARPETGRFPRRPPPCVARDRTAYNAVYQRKLAVGLIHPCRS